MTQTHEQSPESTPDTRVDEAIALVNELRQRRDDPPVYSVQEARRVLMSELTYLREIPERLRWAYRILEQASGEEQSRDLGPGSSQWQGESPATGPFEYLSRNALWLKPFAATLVTIGALLMIRGYPPEIASLVPHWLLPLTAAVGCFSTGLGAGHTDTMSGEVVRLLGLCGGVGILIVQFFF